MSQKVKYILLGFIGLNIILIIGGILFLTRSYQSIVVKPNKPKNLAVTKPTATPTPDPDRPYSILLMGYGGGKHEGGRLTDSIIVARIEPKKQKVTLISIPRDLWVPIPINGDTTKSFKINAAYAIGSDDRTYPNKKIEFTGNAGGGEMAKYVVSKVVGFPIDFFVALDFQGFVKTVDMLGGIDVKVQKTFDDPMYPIEKDVVDNCGKSDEEIAALTATMSGEKLEKQFPCRYETLHFEKGLQHLDGQTALKFTRSRHSPTDGGDFNRAARQRLVINAVKDRVISLNFIPKIIPFIRTLSGNMQTDIALPQMEEYISKSSQLTQYEIQSLALTDQNVLIIGKSADGQSILRPGVGETDYSQIQAFINDPSILSITPTSKPSPQPTP
ncbi:MAG TPA: LCP family protein [Patescibacteria group bacterium]